MSTPVGVDLTLNTADYTQQAGLAIASTNQLSQNLSGLSAAANQMNRGWDNAAPKRSHIALLGGFTAAAAQSQQQLSSFAATQAITGQRTDQLGRSVRQLARDMPIGQQAALQTVGAFTQLGLSARGQEKQVASLSRTMAQLQGANGGSAPQFASSMTQLERTFGDQGIDPRRVSATADSLTTVSKVMGANAQSVLDFTNAIGPMAQAAGIGKTPTLGIAAAFSRIGQDGGYAATAVNKILQDMTASVAGGGGGNLATYANIVGTTADNFERLFKANPAQAITAVTQAIGNAGPQGPAMLGRLGLEGVRTQNALQAISASGGLQGAINTAVSSYGSGSTQRAANEAFGGVLDNFSKAGSAAGQFAVAIGTPVLRPLGLFAQVLARVTGGAAGFLDTGVGRGVAGAVGMGGIGLLAARRLFGIGSTAAIARQVGTSGPIGSMVYGMRSAMGQEIQRDASGAIIGAGRPGSVWNRTAGYMGRAQEEGRLQEGVMGGVNTRAMGVGAAIGGYRMQRQGAREMDAIGRYVNASASLGEDHPLTQRYLAEASAFGPGGRAPGGGVVRRTGRAFGTAFQAYANVTRAGFDMAAEPDPTARTAAFSRRMGAGMPVGATAGVWGAFRGGADAEGGLSAAMTRFNANLAESNKRFPSFLRGLGALVGMGPAGIAAGADAASGAASGAGRWARGRAAAGGLASGAVGLLSSPMVLTTAALVGGGYLANKYMHRDDAQRAQAAELGQTVTSPTSSIDRYNEALGLAATNTQGFAGQLADSTKQIAASVTTYAQAMNSTGSAVTGLAGGTATPATTFPKQASDQEIASQVRSMSPTGLSPQQTAGINAGLVKQYGPTRAQNVMKLLGLTPAGTYGTGPGAAGLAGGPGDIANQVRSAAAVPANFTGQSDTSHVTEHDLYATMGSFGVSLKKSAEDTLSNVNQGIQQRFSALQQSSSPAYATQTRLRDIQAAMKTASQSGNEAVFRELSQTFEKDLGAKNVRVTSSEARSEGGYLQALARRDPAFADALTQMQLPTGRGGQGVSLTGRGVSPDAVRSPIANQMRPYSLLRDVFDNTLARPGTPEYGPSNLRPVNPRGNEMYAANRAMQATLGFTDVSSGDPMRKSTQAVEQFVTATQKAGGSLNDLSAQAQKAAIANADPTSPAYQRLMAISGESQMRQQAQLPFMSSGQQIGTQLQGDAAIINAGPGRTADTQQAYQDARKDMVNQTVALQQQVKQRLEIQRSYQINSTRAQEDYQTQVDNSQTQFNISQTFAFQDYQKQKLYAQQDFQRQSAISARDYQTSTQRANEDYQTQVFRSQQQFNISRGREERDFNIQATQSQEDYLTTRSRAIRDFNIQLSRQIEDQTKTLYDPYKRIQTQAVWDAHQLLANMGEQNAAIQKQTDQLAQARKMGLSNAAITQLDLNNPQNAQQLAMLMNNFLSDPKLISQINSSVSQRTTLGKVLITDPSNTEMARAKADLATQLGDMSADFDRAVARNKKAFRTSLADQAADYALTMSQGAADFHRTMARQQQDYNTAMGDAASEFGISMRRMDDAYATSSQRATFMFDVQMQQMAKSYSTQMARMKADVVEAQKEIVVPLDQLWDTANNIVKGKSADTNKFMRTGLTDTVGFIKNTSNMKNLQSAYKNIYPFDIGQLFKGGPDEDHMPAVAPPGAHGGPYGMYMNGGQRLANSLFGGGSSGASVSQPYGAHMAGAPRSGGGWPVSGPVVTQNFGDGASPGHSGHPGIDLAVPTGTPISSPLPGVVVFAGWNDGYGNCTIVDNGGGRSTLYGHQERTVARVGQKLKPGDLIGYVDSTGNSTGPHLHFETRINGQVQNPAVDLPQWEATAGLGSFNPGATAAAYGVGNAEDLKSQFKDDLNQYSGKYMGPWGSYVQVARALQDLASTQGESVANLQNMANFISPWKGTGTQLGNARTITNVANRMGLGQRGDLIGLITSLAEANLENLNYGDRDSLGLFQQRPSQGWGSPAQLLDPTYAATKFYTTMVQMVPNWRGMDPGVVAQTVQRSAYPARYDQQIGEAQSIMGQLGLANGGIVTKPVNTNLRERGTDEAVIPLNASGVSVLAQAFGMAVSADQLRGMVTAGSGDRISYVSQLHTEDHSVNIPVEKLEVIDSDPVSMARKLEARARSRSLVRGRSTG